MTIQLIQMAELRCKCRPRNSSVFRGQRQWLGGVCSWAEGPWCYAFVGPEGRACQREIFSKGATETGSQGPVFCGWRTQHRGQKWVVVDDTLQPQSSPNFFEHIWGGGTGSRSFQRKPVYPAKQDTGSCHQLRECTPMGGSHTPQWRHNLGTFL